MFWKVNFESINLLQKANLNENLLWKVDLNGKSRKYKKIQKNLNPYIKMDKRL